LRRPRPDLSLIATSVATGSRDIQWGWNPVGGARDFTANETPNDLVAIGIIGTVTIT